MQHFVSVFFVSSSTIRQSTVLLSWKQLSPKMTYVSSRMLNPTHSLRRVMENLSLVGFIVSSGQVSSEPAVKVSQNTFSTILH